ncbi:hypothetical protein [Spongiimicrobium sp. 3-5]|uniref:hypothetical protein n=1 Tax=Spongiimicrobium sp. 3-5 TaxID=3332596 RepID=UPI00397F1392
MKKIILVLFLMVGTHSAKAQLESDKVLHFGAGALSGALGALVAHELSDGNRGWTFAGSVGASLLAGLAKEAIDQRDNNAWDNGDLAATVLGGITVGVTIDIFTAKKRRKARNIAHLK